MKKAAIRGGTIILRVISALAAVALMELGARAAAAQSLIAHLGPTNVVGDEPIYLNFGAGGFNIQGHRSSDPSGLAQIELHLGRRLFFFGPVVGLLANTHGGVFGYGGIYSDLTYGRLIVTPLAGLGGYSRGKSIDLGGTFQFRLSLNIAYRIDNASRLGLQFAHISNAGIHDRNPGENEWLLTYSIPLHFTFPWAVR
jgi:hypothetical protein